MSRSPQYPAPITFPSPDWWQAGPILALRRGLDELPAPVIERRRWVDTLLRELSHTSKDAALRAAAAVLADLRLLGWTFAEAEGACTLAPPARSLDPAEEKRRVQAQLASERGDQLREPAVRAFIRRMESPRQHAGTLVSVFSLLRDGAALAEALRAAAGRPAAVTAVVQPYLQVVHGEERCEHTGLMLREIWRYFRHTWATPYKATPGRGMAVLVRDRAAIRHPVIGIALIGSPAAQIAVRDAWLGWSPEAVLRECATAPSEARARWVERTLREELGELFVGDLLEDAILSPAELRVPSDATLLRLRGEAASRRAEHGRCAVPAELKHLAQLAASDPTAWERLARLPLYRAKRAELLASLLQARAALGAHGEITPGTLMVLASSQAGATALRTLARRSKARRMGVAMGEIAVCGSVSPYRELLGGKLVSLLMLSPEVRAAYAERYDESQSVIASATAARPIRRSSELVLLMTTSLYGSSASQYNRLRLPRPAFGRVGPALGFEELGHTEGFGSSQFSDATVEALANVLAHLGEGRRINSVFGEGVSPRLRKVREGLEVLGLPAGALLQHGSPRLVYGIPLADNAARFLQGLDEAPVWSIDGADPVASTATIAGFWAERWLAPRSLRPEVLAAVEAHTLDRPVRHGARAVVPADDGQLGLFS